MFRLGRIQGSLACLLRRSRIRRSLFGLGRGGCIGSSLASLLCRSALCSRLGSPQRCSRVLGGPLSSIRRGACCGCATVDGCSIACVLQDGRLGCPRGGSLGFGHASSTQRAGRGSLGVVGVARRQGCRSIGVGRCLCRRSRSPLRVRLSGMRRVVGGFQSGLLGFIFGAFLASTSRSCFCTSRLAGRLCRQSVRLCGSGGSRGSCSLFGEAARVLNSSKGGLRP